MKFCIENIIKKLLVFTNFSPQNHDFELENLPSITVMYLPSASALVPFPLSSAMPLLWHV